jgi:hypothetical protein
MLPLGCFDIVFFFSKPILFAVFFEVGVIGLRVTPIAFADDGLVNLFLEKSGNLIEVRDREPIPGSPKFSLDGLIDGGVVEVTALRAAANS